MILVTGVNGQLGYDVVKVLNQRDIPCKGIDIEDLDITDKLAVMDYIKATAPVAVIHCAAYTAVDKAEEQMDVCRNVNASGTENIALACKEAGAKMMYISTDYVFSGEGTHAFKVSESTAPLGAYGMTKLEGEQAVQKWLDDYFIVRISWVFGSNGNNFINTMLRLGKEKDQLNVVCDQVGSPTYTADLVVLLCDMIVTEKYGVYHATNEGYCSWAEFAQEIMDQAGLACKINPIPTREYPTPAKRPLNSRLSKESLDRAGFARLPDWKDSLKRYLDEVNSNEL